MRLRNLVLLLVIVITVSCQSDKDYLIKIETRHGDMYAILYDDTPIHKENFLKYAKAGRYDSTEFQRVMNSFMIQGGDVFTKEELPAEEWPTIQQEILPRKYFHKRGAIGAPRQPDVVNPLKASNGSQFYIVDGRTYGELELTTNMKELQKAILKYMELGSQAELKAEYNRLYTLSEFDSLTKLILSKRDEIAESLNMKLTKDLTRQEIETYTSWGGAVHLDDEYTVFGEVIQGFEVIDKIASEATNDKNRPFNPVYLKVVVEQLPRSEIESRFDFQYPNE